MWKSMRLIFIFKAKLQNIRPLKYSPTVATILEKINGKPRPPPPPPRLLHPKSRVEKWRVFALRAASSLIWRGWGFAVPFYFVQDCSSITFTQQFAYHWLRTAEPILFCFSFSTYIIHYTSTGLKEFLALKWKCIIWQVRLLKVYSL